MVNGIIFHRFFEFQPDLNFKNPKVLSRHAISCFGLPRELMVSGPMPFLIYGRKMVQLVKIIPKLIRSSGFSRAVIDYIRPNTLLLAETCQRPQEVVKYFGDGDECNAGYHFPLMPQMFKSLAAGEKKNILNIY
ncbi:MAG: hypothetical protein R2750_03500 [Bacteroidales bacterium]